MKKYQLLIFYFLLSASILLPQSDRSGGTFTYGEEQLPEVFDPYSMFNNMAAFRISQLIFEPLVALDEFGAVKGKLASGWVELEENKSIKFKLRENVKWHDGEPFTAEDVEFTLKALQNPRSNINDYYKGLAENISSINIVDDEIEIFFEEPVSNLVKVFTNFFIYPKHYFYGSLINAGELKGSRIVGTGPFRFKTINSGNKIRLEKNTDYYEDVNFDQVVSSIQIDPDMGVQELKFGASDMKVRVPNREIGPLEAAGDFRVFPYSSLRISAIAVNFSNPLLQNKLVRKAMLYGTDRSSILSSIYYGYGQLISGPFPPNSIAYNPDVQVAEYSLYKAKNYLSNAGAIDTDEDGIREMNGEKLEFNLLVPVKKDDVPLIQVADAIKSDLRKIGIKVNVVRYEWNEFMEKVTKLKSFDLALFSLVFDENVNTAPLFYGGEKPGEKNITNYFDPSVDELYDQFDAAEDLEEKRTILYKLHETLAEDVPYVFLWTLNSMAVYHKKIRNVTIDPFKFFQDVNEWYIDENYR